MSNKVQIYPGDGKLENLKITCNGDEDVFRAKLIKLERIDEGKTTKATYERVPFDQDYVKKDLSFFDTTDGAAPTQPAGTNEVFKAAEVYLSNKPATVAVYRQK